jgi:hypothetical protein
VIDPDVLQVLGNLASEEQEIQSGEAVCNPFVWEEEPEDQFVPRRTSSERIDFSEDPELTGKDVSTFCICHQISLAGEAAAKSDGVFRSLSANVQAFLGAIRRSPKENQLLIDECGLTILHPPATRWLGQFICLKRLVDLRATDKTKKAVDNVLLSVNNKRAERGDPDILINWDEVKLAVNLLEPLFKAITALEGSDYYTAHMALYTVTSLRAFYYQLFTRDLFVFKDFAQTIGRQIEQRFRDYYPYPTGQTPAAVNDPSWLIAGLLDPWLATYWQGLDYLDDGLLLLKAHFLNSPLAPSRQNEADTSGLGPVPVAPETPPTPSSFLPAFLASSANDSPPSPLISTWAEFNAQLLRYMSFVTQGGCQQTEAEVRDPLHIRRRLVHWWGSRQYKKFGLLKKIVFAALTRPASSAMTER